MKEYIKNYIELHIQSLNQDLEQLSNRMDAIDPNCKEFADLDIEYNWTSGQVSACSHILEVIEEREITGWN
jgi:hypothetical protein